MPPIIGIRREQSGLCQFIRENHLVIDRCKARPEPSRFGGETFQFGVRAAAGGEPSELRIPDVHFGMLVPERWPRGSTSASGLSVALLRRCPWQRLERARYRVCEPWSAGAISPQQDFRPLCVGRFKRGQGCAVVIAED